MIMNEKCRDENALAEERRLLEAEKVTHLCDQRRVHHEQTSLYRHLPTFKDRYLLQHLLGRGGFGEVWKCYDLKELRDVAVKFHHVDKSWSSERVAKYVQHALRECCIQREMDHPRVIRLYDAFEADDTVLATVLEYCKGSDLDAK